MFCTFIFAVLLLKYCITTSDHWSVTKILRFGYFLQ